MQFGAIHPLHLGKKPGSKPLTVSEVRSFFRDRESGDRVRVKATHWRFPKTLTFVSRSSTTYTAPGRGSSVRYVFLDPGGRKYVLTPNEIEMVELSDTAIHPKHLEKPAFFIFSYGHLPREAFEYAWDQFSDLGDRGNFPITKLAEDEDDVIVEFRSEEAKEKFESIIYEKIIDMSWEVRHGERDDFTNDFLQSVRIRGIPVERKFSAEDASLVFDIEKIPSEDLCKSGWWKRRQEHRAGWGSDERELEGVCRRFTDIREEMRKADAEDDIDRYNALQEERVKLFYALRRLKSHFMARLGRPKYVPYYPEEKGDFPGPADPYIRRPVSALHPWLLDAGRETVYSIAYCQNCNATASVRGGPSVWLAELDDEAECCTNPVFNWVRDDIILPDDVWLSVPEQLMSAAPKKGLKKRTGNVRTVPGLDIPAEVSYFKVRWLGGEEYEEEAGAERGWVFHIVKGEQVYEETYPTHTEALEDLNCLWGEFWTPALDGDIKVIETKPSRTNLADTGGRISRWKERRLGTFKEQLMSVLMSADPAKGLEKLRKSGVLAKELPEVQCLVGLEQLHTQKWDAWEHTLKVIEHLPSEPLLRLVGLLHDIGKPGTHERGFIDHAVFGAKLAEKVMERLGFDEGETEYVRRMIECHDISNDVLRDGNAVESLYDYLGGEGVEALVLFRRADAIAHGTDVREECLLDWLIDEYQSAAIHPWVLRPEETKLWVSLSACSYLVASCKNCHASATVPREFFHVSLVNLDELSCCTCPDYRWKFQLDESFEPLLYYRDTAGLAAIHPKHLGRIKTTFSIYRFVSMFEDKCPVCEKPMTWPEPPMHIHDWEREYDERSVHWYAGEEIFCEYCDSRLYIEWIGYGTREEIFDANYNNVDVVPNYKRRAEFEMKLRRLEAEREKARKDLGAIHPRHFQSLPIKDAAFEDLRIGDLVRTSWFAMWYDPPVERVRYGVILSLFPDKCAAALWSETESRARGVAKDLYGKTEGTTICEPGAEHDGEDEVYGPVRRYDILDRSLLPVPPAIHPKHLPGPLVHIGDLVKTEFILDNGTRRVKYGVVTQIEYDRVNYEGFVEDRYYAYWAGTAMDAVRNRSRSTYIASISDSKEIEYGLPRNRPFEIIERGLKTAIHPEHLRQKRTSRVTIDDLHVGDLVKTSIIIDIDGTNSKEYVRYGVISRIDLDTDRVYARWEYDQQTAIKRRKGSTWISGRTDDFEQEHGMLPRRVFEILDSVEKRQYAAEDSPKKVYQRPDEDVSWRRDPVPDFLYHGTFKGNVDSILEKGLVPTTVQSRIFPETTTGYVYLTGPPGVREYDPHDMQLGAASEWPRLAILFGSYELLKPKDVTPVVFEVDTSKLDISRFERYRYGERGWRYRGSIPSGALRLVWEAGEEEMERLLQDRHWVDVRDMVEKVKETENRVETKEYVLP